MTLQANPIPAQTVDIELDDRSYGIHIGAGLLDAPDSYRDLPAAHSGGVPVRSEADPAQAPNRGQRRDYQTHRWQW